MSEIKTPIKAYVPSPALPDVKKDDPRLQNKIKSLSAEILEKKSIIRGIESYLNARITSLANRANEYTKDIGRNVDEFVNKNVQLVLTKVGLSKEAAAAAGDAAGKTIGMWASETIHAAIPAISAVVKTANTAILGSTVFDFLKPVDSLMVEAFGFFGVGKNNS